MNAPGLCWAIKPSLVAYVEALDDGVVEAQSPARRVGDTFWFPLAEHDAAHRAFAGAVRLRGHWGMLDLELRDPVIDAADERTTLLVRERGSTGLLPFAALSPAGDGVWTAALTGRGALLLGGQYAPGTPLADVAEIGTPSHE